MNLADIRRKARQDGKEAEGGAASMGAAVVSGPAEPDASAQPAQMESADPPAPFWTSVIPSRTAPSFDPLELLLAGRASALCLEEVSTDEALDKEVTAEEFREFLCFRVSNELYAISIMEIKEIIKPREVTEVPRVPSFISGILSLRGLIIPIFNMHERLGLLSNEQRGKERIVVVKNGDEFAGLCVDEVIQVVKIAEDTMEQPPAVLDGIDREFVSGVGRYEGRMLILLNLENILDLSLC